MHTVSESLVCFQDWAGKAFTWHLYFQASCLGPVQAGKKEEIVTGPMVTAHSAFPNVSVHMMGDQAGGRVLMA